MPNNPSVSTFDPRTQMDQTAVVEGGQYPQNPFAPCPGAVLAVILTNFFARPRPGITASPGPVETAIA
jgi:hypothetical protein